MVDVVGIDVKEFPDLGRAAVARRAFARGERVLVEAPTLKFERAIGDAAMAAAWRAETVAGSESLLEVMMAYGRADLAIRKRVLGFFCGPADPSDASPIDFSSWMEADPVQQAWMDLKLAIQPAASFASRLPALAGLPEAELAKVAAIAVLNQHEHGEGLALFELGAILAHSCSPNAAAAADLVPGRACFVALSPIRPGSLVTACYLPRLWSLAPRPARRHLLLETKLFACCCPRCSTCHDSCAAVPCPSCSGVNRDPTTGRLPLRAPPVPWSHLAMPRPPSDPAAEAAGDWACGACGATWGDEAGVLGGPAACTALRTSLGLPAAVTVEAHYRGRVLAADGAAGARPMAELQALVNDCATALGEAHGHTTKARALVVDAAATAVRAAAAGGGAGVGGATPASIARHCLETYRGARTLWSWARNASQAGGGWAAHVELAADVRAWAGALLALAESHATVASLRGPCALGARHLLDLVIPQWEADLGPTSAAVVGARSADTRAAAVVAATGGPAAADGDAVDASLQNAAQMLEAGGQPAAMVATAPVAAAAMSRQERRAFDRKAQKGKST